MAIYVYTSTVEFDPETEIKPIEPKIDPETHEEKTYTPVEVADEYFGLQQNSESVTYPNVQKDVIGYISNYAKIAEMALYAEEHTGELSPIVQQTITWIINYLLGENANFIGSFIESDIDVTVTNITRGQGEYENWAQLTGSIGLTLTTKLVDRSGETPIFLDENKNWFSTIINIEVNNFPYYVTAWNQNNLQDRPYFGLAVDTKWLTSEHQDWSVSVTGTATKVVNNETEAITYKSKTYNYDNLFPEEQKEQLINFMQFQSYYLDKLKLKTK